MNQLNIRAFAGILQLFIMLGLTIFLPAWTFDYWQAWIVVAVFFGCTIAITLYLMKNDPKLLERRVSAGVVAEHEKNQKIIQAFAALAFIALFVVSSLDHRFGWSRVPSYLVAIGDVLIVIGFYLVFRVFKENSFASGTIEIGDEQKVIMTGPYALVRHPMYVGAMVMLVGVPLALGSLWGLVALVPMMVVLVARLRDEERFLAKNLAGYCEYQSKVRYHLLPLIW
ncbi:MAG: isoprenylcysteine carboxylmethyltransferase family protein [Candidatus Binatus sp.]|uniref:methyltransferase family protein n=1 Tax=Candidatus Binatus sp. TaxID=2811406 RepID=UPI003BAFCC5C